MMKLRNTLRACVGALFLSTVFAFVPDAQAQRQIRDATAGLERLDGFFPLYWDASDGRLMLEIPHLDEPFLYLTSLATGLGSNALGLDRGLIGDEAVARFRRVGPKVLLVLDNSSVRATDTSNEALTRSVMESFPTSPVGGFDVVAESNGSVLIDFTDFVIRDVMDVRGRLDRGGQGKFTLDRDRSVIYLPLTKAFPRNTEIEVDLTFVSDTPGQEVRRHAPDGRAISLREHHSFVQLPEPGFRPRPFDSRIGIFPVRFYDFSRKLDERYEARYAVRHRLIKQDPGAEVSEPVEPIVYYMDRGIPEPYRTAFKEGAEWYNAVFEAAGFRNAFRVEDMPPDMDPLDARYDVIQWVHRTEAGSSIGPAFVDPRTGEIIKAAVRMDSYRSLVDYNLYAGALPVFEDAADRELNAAEVALNDWFASLDPDVTAEDFAMARRRQHSAHEVGHTLGLAHNFIATSYGRASVMDYPAPYMKIENGRLVLGDSYRNGPGSYDSIAIRYAYTEFSPAEEAAGLDAIAKEAMARGLAFITNPDENAASSHPEASTWINGSDAVAELERVMGVRRLLIDRFDETAIRHGEPMSLLNTRFVSVYLNHRYSIIAATKAIGGMRFRYALRGDPLTPTEMVEPVVQRRALDLLLDAVQPGELSIPEHVLRLMAPRPFGYATDNRAFASAAGPAFDQVGVARTLAEMVISGIFDPQRTARVVAFQARNPDLPPLEEVVQRVLDRTWGTDVPTENAVLKRVAERVVLDELISLASNPDATVEVRAGASWGINRIAERIQAVTPVDPSEQAHYSMALIDIQRYFNSVATAPAPSTPLEAPPGTPIGNRN